MKKLLLIPALLLSFVFCAQELPEKALKKIDKAKEKYDKGEYEESEKILVKLTEDFGYSGYLWGELAKTRFTIYLQKKQTDKLFNNMTITVKDKDGKEKPGNDSLSNALRDMLQQASPSKIAFRSFLDACREGTLRSESADYCSIYIRINMIDQRVDTAVSDSAYNEFEMAEQEFRKRNAALAKEHYMNAIKIDPTFYKARLYLGDAYYVNEEYTGAIKYFKEATQVKPNQQEAWKFLTDAYYHTRAYPDAVKSCTEGILLYPDAGMFYKLADAYEGTGKKFDRHWMARKAFPKMSEDNLKQKNKDKDWQVYLDALTEIKPFCNAKGVVTKTNTLTQGLYADVYAFEKMVKQSKSPDFDFARQMMLKGYFDCYVLFSLYHYDINAQYQNFAMLNKDKLKEYINFLSN